MSFTIGNNLIAKSITPANVQVKPSEKSEEPPPALIQDSAPSQAPLSNETASVFTALFTPALESSGASENIVSTEKGFVDGDFWMEWTDDVPEMKHDFEEVEVSMNEKVDTTDTDNSEEHDEEKEPGENYNSGEPLEEDIDSLCPTNQ